LKGEIIMDLINKRLKVKEALSALGTEGFEGGFYNYSEFLEILLNELIDVMDEKQLDYVMKRIKETSEKNK
jgi:hypothetical protein